MSPTSTAGPTSGRPRWTRKKRGRYDDWAKGVVNPQALSLDKKGKYLYYLSGGKLGRVALASGKPEPIGFEARIEVQKTEDYRQMLGEIYYVLEHYYYDETHHDLNWKKAYDAFLPVLSQVREDADFYDYANMMIGLLNSSHTGVSGPRAPRTEKPTAHVGVRWTLGQDAITVGHLFKNGPLWLPPRQRGRGRQAGLGQRSSGGPVQESLGAVQRPLGQAGDFGLPIRAPETERHRGGQAFWRPQRGDAAP